MSITVGLDGIYFVYKHSAQNIQRYPGISMNYVFKLFGIESEIKGNGNFMRWRRLAIHCVTITIIYLTITVTANVGKMIIVISMYFTQYFGNPKGLSHG